MTKCKIFPQWGRGSGWWNFRDTRILPFANYFLPGPHYEPRERDVMVMVQHLCDVAYLFVRPERQTSSSVRAQTFDFRNPEPPKWGKQQNKKKTGPRTQATNPARHEMPFIFSAFAEKIATICSTECEPNKEQDIWTRPEGS